MVNSARPARHGFASAGEFGSDTWVLISGRERQIYIFRICPRRAGASGVLGAAGFEL